MEVEDDTIVGSASSIILESLESTQQGEKLSDEDLAWVNSCLVTDTEILETDWTSFKDVLLEIIGDQPETLDPSVTGSNWNLGGTETSIVPSVKEEESDSYLGKTQDNLLVIPMDGDYETNSDNIPIKKRSGTKLQFLQEDSSETFWGDPFRPTYKEEEGKANLIELGTQSSLSEEEMNSSTLDIFRVWDLDIPDEEGDLKELNKIAGKTSSFQSMPLAFDSSTAWKDPKDEPIDDIIAAIADLSLTTQRF
ncbi:Glycosyl hydrolase 9B18 [Hibiscus syriacus]|uniref:Glycosyl hydrolase 9B18 n=1 Tax=Hibiscus syriacus TaxID=106335 RepID=A0A6A3CN15_HIBSY|nr:uncharacterized protein LOC120187208 [Hibiscus syriacus]KAE8728982.1 Glycosyl hydrolase 9B18 [Hibiscus syriacus]